MLQFSRMNVDKHIAYWLDGIPRAMRGVPIMLQAGLKLEALFFTHLALEKAFKARVVERTHTVPPKTHNLKRLAELAEIELSRDQRRFCDALVRYQVLTRYEDFEYEEPLADDVAEIVRQAEDMMKWLIEKL